MRRRSFFRWLASLAGALRIAGLRSWAQTASFPAAQEDILEALATAVLPAELGAARVQATAAAFAVWVREYRPGAEMDHGYGNTRLRSKPPSPAPVYLRQLEALRPAILNAGPEAQRQTVAAALEAANVNDLPRTPDGRHVAADLMSFFFRGSDANDLCYRAAIGRDQCRGLAGSEQAPPPLKGPA